MDVCSEPANVSSGVNGDPKKRKVAIITGITGQVTTPTASSERCTVGMNELVTQRQSQTFSLPTLFFLSLLLLKHLNECYVVIYV